MLRIAPRPHQGALRGFVRATFGAAVAATLVLSGGAGANATPSTSQNSPLDPSTLTEAREFLAQHGVTTDVQDELIRSAARGERWDSMTSDNTPVSTVSRTADDGEYTTNTYEDGSVSVIRLETPSRSRGISGCTVQGNLRSNCKIDTWVGLVSMSFFATYNLGTARVNNVYGGGWSIGGSCSSSQIYLGRPAANIGLQQVSAQMCGAAYNTVFSLKLTVAGGNASVSWY